VWELFWPLLAGARLVMARPGGHRDSAYLGRVFDRQAITTVHFVPAMLRAFLDDRRGRAAAAGGGASGVRFGASLRRVMASGEALGRDLVESFHAACAAPLHNLYGPTEAAVDVTFWACERGDPRRLVPIGRPVANTRIHLLDPAFRQVPIGAAGELHIGGVQLARGYLGRPDLTAERFVPDPHADSAGGTATAGARLYRTGDLARHLPDGTIDYLGRTDHQVKIRGFRIEPGEIEAALAAHPEIQEAAVVPRRDAPGEARLAAYVVPHAAPAPAAAELRAFLAARLPAHLVPAHFVALTALPLSPNGKLDRAALPAPQAAAGDSARPAGLGDDGAAGAPATPAEAELGRIWSAILGVPAVASDDNFFALGGDSILGVQVVARAREAGLALEVSDLFRCQSLAELAAAAIPLAASEESEEGGGEVPLLPIQRWFFAQELCRPHHFNQAVLLRLRAGVTAAALDRALAAVLGRHPALGYRFTRDRQGRWRQQAPAAGGWRQAVGRDGSARPDRRPLARLDLSALPAPRRRAALEAAAARLQGSLDLAAGPLLRAASFHLGDAGDRLLLIVHHLVVDGVSWRILLADLVTAWEALQRGEAPRFTTPAGSPRRWAQRLTAATRSAAAAAEGPYWLDPARRGILPLPLAPSAPAETARVRLTRDETGRLLRALAAGGFRIDAALLAALAHAVRVWTGERRLLFDMEGHGRDAAPAGLDATGTVGWLATLFPLLVELPASDADAPEAALTAAVTALQAVPRGGAGYGLLRYPPPDTVDADRRLARELAAMPQAQVLFNYLGQLDRGLPAAAPFTLAGESPGAPRDPADRHGYAVEMHGGLRAGRLDLTWSFAGVRPRRLQHRLLADFRTALAGFGALASPCLGGARRPPPRSHRCRRSCCAKASPPAAPASTSSSSACAAPAPSTPPPSRPPGGASSATTRSSIPPSCATACRARSSSPASAAASPIAPSTAWPPL